MSSDSSGSMFYYSSVHKNSVFKAGF